MPERGHATPRGTGAANTRLVTEAHQHDAYQHRRPCERDIEQGIRERASGTSASCPANASSASIAYECGNETGQGQVADELPMDRPTRPS